MVAFKPIPDALWLRLAALEPRCAMSMWRDRQWLAPGTGGRMVWLGIGGPPSPTRVVWRVRIHPRGSVAVHDIIDVAEPHLADGLEAAVGEAERRGWHSPASASARQA